MLLVGDKKKHNERKNIPDGWCSKQKDRNPATGTNKIIKGSLFFPVAEFRF